MLSSGGLHELWCRISIIEHLMLLVPLVRRRLDCERVVIRTASGPGGTSGPLRLDLDGQFCRNPLQVGNVPHVPQQISLDYD